ncbi:MAG TPA: hypothetical protein VG890_06765 [Puia sp.]|nr:hypothetical protein [Puia sp.]
MDTLRICARSLLLTILAALLFKNSRCQLERENQKLDTSTMLVEAKTYPNMASGEFTPGKGFDLVRTKYGSLNFSVYALVRYLNQLPGKQTWTDHLGNEYQFTGRNDFYWHRTMLWFSGFLLTPKLTYMATVWTIMTTQQTLVYGNIQYAFNKHIRVGMGIFPNLSIRSMQGPFPYYLSTDRTMGEEQLRAGFTNGLRVSGEVVPKLSYTLFLGDNLSALGISAGQLTRHLSKGVSLLWMPTTGEFGPRGGLGDIENHETLATRFGVSYTHCRENRFNETGPPAPDETQIRNTDGVLFFQTGSLANNVTVQEANYDMFSVDLGMKYRGFGIQAEVYGRTLSKFDADGPLPISRINDYAYSLQIYKMVVPRILNVYAIHSYVFDQWGRRPWEAGGGVNVYPMKSRSWRLNVQVDYIYKSGAGGTFGLYTAGQTGPTITVGSDIIL